MKKSILISALMVGLFCNLPALAKSVALNDLNDFSIDKVKPSDKGKAFDPNHWAYKTLKNVTDKYGVLIGRPGESFDGTRPISRNEAAIILVNLMGKVQEQNMKVNEGDRAKIEILQQELNGEIASLTGRVEAVEKSVAELKGSVSNIEESSKKSWKNAFGEDFKITGGLQAGYTAIPKRGSSDYSPNFGLPYGEVTFSGKLHKHFNYMAQLVPTRNFIDLTSLSNHTLGANGLLREAYVSTDIIPRHTVYLGQVTRPIGREASLSPMGIDFVDYSQLSRKLIGNNPSSYDPRNQDVGAMISGNWEPVSYALGTFNGTGQNSFDGNRSQCIAGQITVRPLFKTPQLGSLELGSSMMHGYNGFVMSDDGARVLENLLGFHGGYTYNKFNVKGELMYKRGYINSGQLARAWNIDTKYNLTNKLALLARYDNFNPNMQPSLSDAESTINNSGSTEYIGGFSYALTDNLSAIVNFVSVNNKFGKGSQRVGFLTQYLF